MIIIGLCIALLAFALMRKGLRYALCLLPGATFFVAVEAGVSYMVTPSAYLGDFLDIFLPFVTIPLQIVLILVAAFLALRLNRVVLRIAYKESHPNPRSAYRFVGAAFLAIIGVALVALDLGGPSLMRYEQSRAEEQAFERANDAISLYGEERIGAENLSQIIGDLPREVSCARSFAPEIETLLEQGDRKKAAILVQALGRSCFDSPTLDDLVRNRQYDGAIHDLDTLLAIGVASHRRLLEVMGKYALSSNNDDDFLTLLSYFLDTKEPSPGALRTLLLLAGERGGKQELLARFFAKAGPDPLRYLTTDDFDTLNSAFLGSAVNNLNPDLLKFYIDMGFDKDLTRYGSTFFSFVYARGGPAILQRLIDKGADPNAVDAQGFTPLLLLLWRPETDMTPYDPEQERKVVEIFDLLFALSDHRLYVTPDGQNMLHEACSGGRYSPEGIAEIAVLLKAGADPLLVGKELPTPIEIAEKHGWKTARDLLLGASSR